MPDLQTSANLPLAQLRVGHNHRKYVDEEKLAELTASVKKYGLLQPILVRPLAKPAGKVTHETVAGERRYRAAKAAGLKEIPVVIRELGDKEALEVGLIENLRRADVLPMEEAEGYLELHEVHKESVEQIAERVGKSKEYVYGRLKLCELRPDSVRRALAAGKVNPSTALLIARIPGEKLQEQAAKKILEGGAWDEEASKPGPMSHRRAQDLVTSEYMLQLGKAPFSPKDAKLVPEAGACGPCPKRTGNCAEMYPDVKSANVCTDPECFGKKKAAAFKAAAAEAKAEGKKLLKDSPSLWNYEGKALNWKGKEKYVELEEKVPGDKKGRTFKQLLGDKAPVVLARSPDGKVHELLEKNEGLVEALAEAGHKVKAKGEGPGRDYEKERAEEAFRERVVQRLLRVVHNKLASRESDALPVLRMILAACWAVAGHQMKERWTSYAEGPVEEHIETADTPTLLLLLVDYFLAPELERVWSGYTSAMKDLCSLAGVKLDDLEEEQRQADAAAPTKLEHAEDSPA